MSTIIGEKLKSLREGKQITQRQLASVLGIDTATYCKIEKGDRRARREQILALAELLQFDTKELLRLWSADKVYALIVNEEEATRILDVVAESIINDKKIKEIR